jgi:hypothetical protein
VAGKPEGTLVATSRDNLPDMEYMRKAIPIIEVADELGIRRSGASLAHCWREGHQHGDRSPSMSFHKNRAKCFVCDAGSLSTIDLIMKHGECSLADAVRWIEARWDVPRIAKNKKLSRPERWGTVPVGLANFPLENLVRAGLWAAFKDAERAVLVAILCFVDPVARTAEISHRALCRYAGKASRTTIAKVIERFEHIGLVEVTQAKTREGIRQVSTYKLTMNSEKFENALSECYQRFKVERDQERQYRSELRAGSSAHSQAPSPTTKTPQLPKSNTLHTVVDTSPSERCTTVDRGFASQSSDSERKPSKPALSGIDSKATWETPRFTLVDSRQSGGDDMARTGVA